MDIQMPELDGIEATRFITGRQPAPRVVMLTMNEDDDTVLSAIRAGASGYLLKGSSADEVQNAVRAAAAGGMVFGAALAGRVATYFASARPGAQAEEPFPDLTERERTVLDMLAAGQVERRHRARAVRLRQDGAQHGVVDLHQAARRRSRRGDRQGAGGRATAGSA